MGLTWLRLGNEYGEGDYREATAVSRAKNVKANDAFYTVAELRQNAEMRMAA